MSFLMGFSLCTLMAIPTMMKLDFQLYIVSILFYIGTAILFTCIFTIDHLLKSYSNIISCLALYSLITCYALRFVWFPEGAVDQSLSIILNSSGTPFINCGLSYVVAIPTYIRNFGIFREPGVYQFFSINCFSLWGVDEEVVSYRADFYSVFDRHHHIFGSWDIGNVDYIFYICY